MEYIQSLMELDVSFWLFIGCLCCIFIWVVFYAGVKYGEGRPMDFSWLKYQYPDSFNLIRWYIVGVGDRTKKGKHRRQEAFVMAGDYGDERVWHVYFSEKNMQGFPSFKIKVGDHVSACTQYNSKYSYGTVVYKKMYS